MAYDPASRFQLVQSAALSPGIDWVTGTDKGPFVDTGCDIAFGKFGRLYLTVDTIREMAEQAGIFNEGRADGLVAREAAVYNEGYAAALRENDIGQLRDISARLLAVADGIARGGVDPALESEPALDVADAEASGDVDPEYPAVFVTDVDDAGEPAGQSPRPARRSRSARVSADSGDVATSAYRI